MINLKEVLIYLITIGLLGTAYVNCFNVARTGYGYSGYKGFEGKNRPFFTHHPIYGHFTPPSNRELSENGNRFSRRGLNGGK